MPIDDTGIVWNPKVPQGKIRRLYELDARGIVDTELIDEVGYALYARCQSILLFEGNRVQCPRCDHVFATGWHWHKRNDTMEIRCPHCQTWTITGQQYRYSIQSAGVAASNALPAFRTFVERYPIVQTPRERMILIDRVIHQFHYALARLPDGSMGRNPVPHAISGNNLIEGTHDQVVAFLDSLAYGGQGTPEVQAAADEWRAQAQNMQQRRGRGSLTAGNEASSGND